MGQFRNLALFGSLLLTACGGGEGTPRTAGDAGMAGMVGTSGTGGGSGSSGAAPMEDCPSPTPIPGGAIAPLETDGDRLDGTTGGGWFFFHPGENDDPPCPTCMTNPAPGEPPTVVLEDTDPPRSGSTKAMHWTGSDFVTGTYGAGMGIYLDNCASVPSDVTGIRFFYRSDSTLTLGSTRLGRDYTVALPSAEEWTEEEALWTELMPATGFDPTHISGFFWRVPGPTNGTFSVWLDDVAWIGGTSP